MKIKDENENVQNIGNLLITDKENNPLKEKLSISKLNINLNSLREIDKYLEIIRKNKKKLNEREIKQVILRCGTYLGEVIRKTKPDRFIWVSYDVALKMNKGKMPLEQDISTIFILYDKTSERFWFPLGKAYKFIEYGKADSLWAFAKICLGKLR